MDQRVRQAIVTRVRWLADEVAPHDPNTARTMFEGLVTTYGIDLVVAALCGDGPETKRESR